MNEHQLKRAEELASRPYQIELMAYETPDGKPYFFGSVPEMPGCVSDGETEQEAKANVKLAMIDFIYFLLEDGLPVPGPKLLDKRITINMSNDEHSSPSKRATAHRRSSLRERYTGAKLSDLGHRVYVAYLAPQPRTTHSPSKK